MYIKVEKSNSKVNLGKKEYEEIYIKPDNLQIGLQFA